MIIDSEKHCRKNSFPLNISRKISKFALDLFTFTKELVRKKIMNL